MQKFHQVRRKSLIIANIERKEQLVHLRTEKTELQKS